MKPQPLLYLHPLDQPVRILPSYPNYDGQGKSQQQETDDSLRMLRIVSAVIMVVSLVLAAVLVLR